MARCNSCNLQDPTYLQPTYQLLQVREQVQELHLLKWLMRQQRVQWVLQWSASAPTT